MPISKEELKVVLRYAHMMSRRVSPASLSGHDGAMADFYRDLSVMTSNGGKMNIEKDEFYKEVFARMKEAVDTEYGDGY